MTRRDIVDRTLALAGIFQAAGLVQEAATRGTPDPRAFETSIRSLFEINPSTAEAVFDGAVNLRPGLKSLIEHLSGKKILHESPVVKYVVGTLYLERQLAKRADMLQRIRVGLEKARPRSERFTATDGKIVADLATIYSDTISTLSPRIMVSGEHGRLSDPAVADTVRALLLAAIRSAVLWRQRGGNRIQLLFGRNKLLAEARRLLDGI